MTANLPYDDVATVLTIYDGVGPPDSANEPTLAATALADRTGRSRSTGLSAAIQLRAPLASRTALNHSARAPGATIAMVK